MFRWFSRFNRLPHQIDLYPARKRMPPVTVRAYRESDFDVCSELYRLNEPARFPDGHLEDFQRSIKDSDRLRYLVVEKEGRIRACGGVGIEKAGLARMVKLCFGMVHPDMHRRGLGTTLLVSRLALISEEFPITVCLRPVESSRSFYERFGFRKSKQTGTEEPSGPPLYVCQFLPADRDECEWLLKKAKVQFDSEGVVVPTIEQKTAA